MLWHYDNNDINTIEHASNHGLLLCGEKGVQSNFFLELQAELVDCVVSCVPFSLYRSLIFF